MASSATGFWSYVHADDAADGGRILRLAKAIQDEYALLTGFDIEVFIDRDDLAWGEEWRKRIDEELQGTVFFIPVITPRYLLSEECRKELLTFAAHAKSLGVSELVLPLLYIDVPELSEEPDDIEDEVLALIARTQYERWTDLRLEDENSPAYRKKVNALARRLVDINAAIDERATESVGASPRPAVEERDGEAGFLEVLAEMEEAMPRLQKVVERFPDLMQAFVEASEQAQQQIERSDAAGKGFAGRLTAAHALARRLETPAAEILQLGSQYASELQSVDAGLLTLIRRADEEDLADDDRAAFCEMFESIREFGAITRENADQLRALIVSLEETAALARVLRPPLGQIRDGLHRVSDGQGIIEEWLRRIDESEIGCPPAQ